MAELLTESTYQESTAKGVTLVDVYADWCGPCKQIAPIIEELSNEAVDYKVFKVDADQTHNVLSETGVRSIPTILVYKDGKIVDRHVGLASKQELDALATKHL